MPVQNVPASSAEGTPNGAPAPGAAATEAVDRPEPGLARGRWEAPAWVFYAIALAAVLGGLAWLVAIARSRKAPW